MVEEREKDHQENSDDDEEELKANVGSTPPGPSRSSTVDEAVVRLMGLKSSVLTGKVLILNVQLSQ